MKQIKNIFHTLCLWSALLSSLSILLAAQGTRRAEPEKKGNDSEIVTRVALASNSGPPGSAVVIPIYFTPAPGVQVGRLKLAVNFVSSSIKFERLERGVAGTIPNLNFTSDTQLGKNEKGLETTALTILAAFSSPESAKKGIPGGILGYLNLRIIAEAPPAIITLHASAEASAIGSNAPIKNLQATDAKIEIDWVDAPPSVNCFFFNH